MESQFKFPTEQVELPSKGLLYPKDSPLSSGTIEMKYMTAREEDILTNQNYIQNGVVIDKLLRSLIVTPVNYDDILICDKNALLVAARILGYGAEYKFEYNGNTEIVDLGKIDNKEVDMTPFEAGVNEFPFTLPTTNTTITFKLLTHGDEEAITKEVAGLKKINKESSAELSTRLKYIIKSVNGKSEAGVVRDFVDNGLLARDSRVLREHLRTFQPDVNLTFYPENGPEGGVDIPIGVSFFWPDASI